MGTYSDDRQPPLERLLLEPARRWKEILVAYSPEDVLDYLREIPDSERRAIGVCARKRVLAEHTAAHRALELEQYIMAAR